MSKMQTDSPAARHGTAELSPAAERALAEARARRQAEWKTAGKAGPVREVDGRGGADPVRYGDWEVKGRAVDF